jgi:ribosome maturation factor RimP
MAQTDVVAQVTEIAQPLLTSLGLEMVEIEYKREGRQLVLRLYIDKEGGISLDDCADVSRELSQILDVEDVIPGNYNLEVSSPGLNRPLKSDADYEKFQGRLVKVRTFELIPDDEGNKRKTFLGKLVGLENGMVKLVLNEGQGASIPLAKVAKANLEFEF